MDQNPSTQSKSRLTPWATAGAVLVVLLLFCCTCAATTLLLTFDTAGAGWGWLTRLFRRPPAEMTLEWALRNEHTAAFQLGGACEFTNVQGNIIDSGLESGGGEGFARDLEREEVIGLAEDALQGDVFLVEAGRARLASGAPVNASLLDQGRVSISFSETLQSGEGTATHSLDGVVEGGRFEGNFSLDGETSTVVNGQGIEGAVSARAGLACPFQPVPAEP